METSRFGMAMKALGKHMAVTNQQMQRISVKISTCLTMIWKPTGIVWVSVAVCRSYLKKTGWYPKWSSEGTASKGIKIDFGKEVHFEKIEMIKRPGGYWWGTDADHKARFTEIYECFLSSGVFLRPRGLFTCNSWHYIRHFVNEPLPATLYWCMCCIERRGWIMYYSWIWFLEYKEWTNHMECVAKIWYF